MAQPRAPDTPHPRARLERGGLAAAAVVLLAPVLVFAPVAVLARTFSGMDVQFYFYPYHRMAADLVAAGHLPLWNPYAFSGLPLLGDGQTAQLFPPNALFLLLPGAAALNAVVLVQYWIAGAGAYLAARHLGAGRLPALVGACAYMLGGFMTARIAHLSVMGGAALLPWVFLATDRALVRGSRRALVIAAVPVALQAVVGHPQVPVYTALAMGLLAAVRAGERWPAGAVAFAAPPLRLAALYVLGYGLAAVQVLPWYELARLSPRAGWAGYEFVLGNSMALRDWLLMLFPFMRGSVVPGAYASASLDAVTAIELFERTAYLGVLPLGLAAVALLGAARRVPAVQADAEAELRRHHRASCLFLALLLLLTALFATGRHTPLGAWIHATPVVGRLRDVTRILPLTSLALALLAAVGLEGLRGALSSWAGRRRVLLGVAAGTLLVPGGVVLAAATGLGGLLGLGPAEVRHLELARPNAWVPLLSALASAALLTRWALRRAGPWTQGAALALVVADVGAFAAHLQPTADPQLYAGRPAAAEALLRDPGPFRKATFLDLSWNDPWLARARLSASWAMLYGIEDVNGYNSLQPRRYTDFLFGPEVHDVSYGVLESRRLLRPDSPVLPALNAKYVLLPAKVDLTASAHLRLVHRDDDVVVYEHTGVWPRAFFAESARALASARAVLRAVTRPGFDARRLSYVEGRGRALPPASPDADSEVAIVSRTPNRLELAVSTDVPRLLVLSEMHLPGWRAQVDGEAVEILPTNYLFRGVVVPAGDRRVTFTYRPPSVAAGLTVTLLALVVAGALWAWPGAARGVRAEPAA